MSGGDPNEEIGPGISVDVNRENPNAADGVFIGDIHNHYYQAPQSSSNSWDIEEKKTELQQILRAKAEIIAGQNSYQPVELEIFEIRQGCDTHEEFGESGIFSSSRIRSPVYSFEVEVSDFFSDALGNAENEASKTDQSQESQHDFVRKRGNVVGVIGSAGVGKTTLGKMVVAHHHEVEGHESDYFMFYLPCRDIDFNETMTVFKFLAQYCVPDWEFSHKSNLSILRKISKSIHSSLIIDGLDEAGILNFSRNFRKMTLEAEGTADRILMNLLAGHILPNMKKLITSRPGVYHMLEPKYKPLFTVRVVGLTEESQGQLITRVCRNDRTASNHAVRLLEDSPTVRALCYNPMFCIMTVQCIQKRRTDDNTLITITQVFASALENCVRHKDEYVRLEEDVFAMLKNLSRLASDGIERRLIAFDYSDIQRYNVSERALETFLSIGVDVESLQVRVFVTDKKYYFSHLTWQEKFAALYLMYLSDMDEFMQLEQEFTHDRWRVVTRFMFGISHPTVVEKLKRLFPTMKRGEIRSKLNRLRQLFLTETAADLSAAFQICNIAIEANDQDILLQTVQVLPETIILDGIIQARDIASLCHVLHNTGSSIPIEFNIFPPQFQGNGLFILVNYFNKTHRQMRRIRVQRTNIGDTEADQISKQVPELEDLRIWRSRVTKSAMLTILDAVSRRTRQLDCLTLTENPLSKDEVDKLATCMSRMKSLRAGHCNITGEKMEMFSRAIASLQQQIPEIKLNGNPLGTSGALQLSRCLHNIGKIRANSCKIDGEGGEYISQALLAQKGRIKVLDLHENELGDRGAIALANALEKIDQLFVKDCGISPVGVKAIQDKLDAGANMVCEVHDLDRQ